jgi:hypothetical protein
MYAYEREMRGICINACEQDMKDACMRVHACMYAHMHSFVFV